MRPHLRSFERAWTDAAFDAIYPAPDAPLTNAPSAEPLRHTRSALALPHGIASMHPARFLDGILASVPLEQALGLRFTLWMVALAPLFTIRRFGTIASIDAASRTRVLERLVTSRIYVVRQLAMSFKAVATLLYAQSDRIRAAMTTPLRRATIERDAEGRGALATDDGDDVRGDLVSATRLVSRSERKGDAALTTRGGSHGHAA